jgi:fatty acid desaturase
MGMSAAVTIMLAGLLGYSAWLTSIVFCAVNGLRPLMIIGTAFFLLGTVHDISDRRPTAS